MIGSYPILFAKDVETRDPARVGGKAAGLARLEQLGAPVPPWCVVSVEALRTHLAEAGLEEHFERAAAAIAAADAADLARIEPLCAGLERALCESKPSPALQREVDAALRRLGPGPFAVRSSMVGEDGASHSFAGQLESFLYQRDLADVVDSLLGCWASAFSARVAVYRRRAGADTSHTSVAVVIQRMVTGQVSGVVFTAHPTTGRRDHVLVTAAWGLGEGVVGGLCDTDEYVWEQGPGKEGAVRVVPKEVMVVRAPDGRGTVECPVAPERQKERCLSPAALEHVASEAIRVATALGAPQDVEWTLDGERLYLLQTRPITSLPVPDNTDGPRLVFNNSNIQESYCGVTTPLTFSFASYAYSVVYEQTYALFGLSEAELKELRPVFRNMLGLVRGRVYYNINNWYRALLILPGFERNKEDMERMMGLDEHVDFVEGVQLGRLEKLRRAPRLLLTLLRLERRFRRLEQSVPEWLASFETHYRLVDRSRLPAASFSELIAMLERVYQKILGSWTIPIVNDFYVMMRSGRLRRLVERSRLPDVGGVVSRLLMTEEGVESTEPVRRLMRMARLARADAKLAAELVSGAPFEALARIREGHPDFAQEIDAFIERYGDRVMGELKLETISLREDPTFLVNVLRSFHSRPDLDADELARREKADREACERELAERLGARDRRRLPGVLAHARAGIRHREAMRLSRTRAFGLARDLYRALGDRLYEAGKLEQPRDVFYLTIEEIFAYHEGRSICADLAGLARVRKAEFAEYERQTLPNHFETVGAVYYGNRFAGPERQSDAAADPYRLQGTGCFPGVVEAELRIVRDPKDAHDLDGRILTALRTDPGWTPLFPACAGILVERGSSLSHSAVVARELGIPAVVGVRDLLEQVRHGELVRLDGALGCIDRIEAREEAQRGGDPAPDEVATR